MSKQPSPPNKQFQQQLTKIRLHLEEHSSKPSLEDEEMLALIISDANKGIDITQEYPAFYQKLLHNAQLRQIFLDALEINDEPAEVTPLPTFFEHITNTNQWRIVWQRTAEQLQTIFMPPPAAQPSRTDLAHTNNETFILLQSEADIEHTQTKLTLTAIRTLEDEEYLQLNLFVESFTSLPFQASLTWGNYHETITLQANTLAHFPPVPLNAVLNEDGETFISGLDLSLEPTHS